MALSGPKFLSANRAAAYTEVMKTLLSALLLLASAPCFAGSPPLVLSPGDVEALKALAAKNAAQKEDPCLQNQQWNFFELLIETAPQYPPSTAAKGAPPSSVILTMDRCETRAVDWVEGIPTPPVAERRYTEGNFGVILTTGLDSGKTWITLIAKRNGAWTNAGQMGEFSNDDLWDVSLKPAQASIKYAHYEMNGLELPYVVRAAFRPSWSR